MKKIILFLVLMFTLAFYGCSIHSIETNTYDSDIDDFSVDYDDDKDKYDVFIEEEQRHIFIPRSFVEIIICDDNEIVVVEEKHWWGELAKMYIFIEFGELKK